MCDCSEANLTGFIGFGTRFNLHIKIVHRKFILKCLDSVVENCFENLRENIYCSNSMNEFLFFASDLIKCRTYLRKPKWRKLESTLSNFMFRDVIENNP